MNKKVENNRVFWFDYYQDGNISHRIFYEKISDKDKSNSLYEEKVVIIQKRKNSEEVIEEIVISQEDFEIFQLVFSKLQGEQLKNLCQWFKLTKDK